MERQAKIINLKKQFGTNSEKSDITSEKLKEFNGLENLSDTEAQETVFALQTLANILYEVSIAQTKNNPLNKAA